MATLISITQKFMSIPVRLELPESWVRMAVQYPMLVDHHLCWAALLADREGSISSCLGMWAFQHLCHHHHHQSLNRKGRWGTTDDLEPVFSIFPCSPLPSGTWQTPGLSIPWCCQPPLLLSALSSSPFARWFYTDALMNGRHVHTTSVYVSLWSSGGLHVVQLPAGSWHGLPRW